MLGRVAREAVRGIHLRRDRTYIPARACSGSSREHDGQVCFQWMYSVDSFFEKTCQRIKRALGSLRLDIPLDCGPRRIVCLLCSKATPIRIHLSRTYECLAHDELPVDIVFLPHVGVTVSDAHKYRSLMWTATSQRAQLHITLRSVSFSVRVCLGTNMGSPGWYVRHDVAILSTDCRCPCGSSQSDSPPSIRRFVRLNRRSCNVPVSIRLLSFAAR
jgi:hypothetical protein